MTTIKVNSYAKINLSLKVNPPMPNGMHPVDTVMQGISLHDEVTITVSQVSDNRNERPEIVLTCDNPGLPLDRDNFAYRAAELMVDRFFPGSTNTARISIDIKKNIPTEAGLAGGSANAASVLHGLNTLWNLNLSLNELLALGAELGSDMPFCVLTQAKANPNLFDAIKNGEGASTAARGTGTGTELTLCAPIEAYVLLAKPDKGVPTKEVYRGIDEILLGENDSFILKPDGDKLVYALSEKDISAVTDQMINMLELYTLEAREDVAELKRLMEEASPNAIKVLMSGSGPSVYALFQDEEEMQTAAIELGKRIDVSDLLKDKVRIYTCRTLSG